MAIKLLGDTEMKYVKYIFIAAFVIMGVFGVLYYYVFTGVVIINSSRPLDAIIKVDTEEVGTVPVKFRVRSGTHTIRAYKDGFEPWEGTVEVSGSAPQTLTVRLRFLLKSEPSGANVTINGKDSGITDMVIDLPAGTYTFVLTKKGYGRTQFIAEIPHNVSTPLPVVPLVPISSKKTQQDTAITADSTTAPPQKGFGSIQITSKPDAQVFLDGELQGETPITLAKIPIGSYVLKLSKEGYADLRQTVYVQKNETTKIAGELKANQ
jgi:hypothetical protein